MARPKNTQTKFAAGRAKQHILTRFNPIRGLTPQRLASQLDAFAAGNLRPAALLWQKILDRDDQVKTCAGKRARKVAGLPWEILTIDESNDAHRHKEALEHFYNNVRAVNALDENEQGGFATLLRQMHSAVGMKYAAHEIVWQPGGAEITAEFRFIPLQFFENTTGRLRFLVGEHDQYGQELDAVFGEGGWMVTTGDGLMEASSVAYTLKSMPLKAWVRFAEKYGIAPLHAETGAAKDSDEWDALREALEGFGEDLAIITNIGAKITPIEPKNSGTSPHAALVDRMDRALSRLWLGGDLATMSAGGQAVGSEPQSDDLGELQCDDAARLTDALQHYVDRWVIRYLFDQEPLAYVELQPPENVDSTRELAIDDKLIGWNVEVSKKDLRARYGRTEPDASDELARPPAPAPSPFGGQSFPARTGAGGADTRPGPTAEVSDPTAAVNEADRATAIAAMSDAQRATFAPLMARLNAVAEARDPVDYANALRAFRATVDELGPQILANPTLAHALEQILGEAAARSAVQTLQEKPA